MSASPIAPHAVALGFIECKTVVVLVDGGAPVELQRRLSEPQERRPLQQTKRRRVPAVMRVNAAFTRGISPVQPRMDIKSRRLRLAPSPSITCPSKSQIEQPRRGDLPKTHSRTGFTKKKIVVPRHDGRKSDCTPPSSRAVPRRGARSTRPARGAPP